MISQTPVSRVPGTSLAATAARGGLYAVLVSWAGLTVARQFRKEPESGSVTGLDPVGTAVPVTRLPAPHPAAPDIHLLRRAKLADGRVTACQEYPLRERRSVRHMLWHPNRRVERLLTDAVSELTQVAVDEQRVRHLRGSTPYLSLLDFVTHTCEHPEGAREVQFLIVSSAGDHENERLRTLFASDFHPLA